LILILIFAWLKMTDICISPYDGNSDIYDIDLVNELHMNIWVASEALESVSHMQS
jgi:hypothetical protein